MFAGTIIATLGLLLGDDESVIASKLNDINFGLTSIMLIKRLNANFPIEFTFEGTQKLFKEVVLKAPFSITRNSESSLNETSLSCKPLEKANSPI